MSLLDEKEKCRPANLYMRTANILIIPMGLSLTIYKTICGKNIGYFSSVADPEQDPDPYVFGPPDSRIY
jgi:hypothetical protein